MIENMDWGGVPDTNVVPGAAYTVEVEDLQEGTSANSGKLMYSVVFRIVEGPSHVGVPLFERFVFGSDSDPAADDPKTRAESVGARRMKAMLKAAGVPLDQNMTRVCQAAVGQQLVLMVQEYTEPPVRKNGQPNEYAGQLRNRIQQFYPVGAVPSSVAGSAPKAPSPLVRTALATVKSTPVLSGPSAPKVAAPKTPAAKPAMAASGKMAEPMKCTMCGEVVAKRDFVAHVNDTSLPGHSVDE